MDSVGDSIQWGNSTDNRTDGIFCGLVPHDYLEVKLILISVVGTIIGSFGIFGNVSTVLILTRPTMRNPNNLFLTTLAIFDTCLLLTAFSIYGMEYIIEYLEAINLYIVWLTYLRFAFALSHISQTGSVYTTVAVTVERFIAVCYPRLSKRFCTSRNTVYCIVGVITFAVMFNSTKFFEVEIVSEPDCSRVLDWQSFHLFPSDLAKHPFYTEVYSLWLTNIVMVFFPFLMLLTLNAIIAYTIRKSLNTLTNKKHTAFNELREKSREASIVLIIIVLIFLLCNFWGFFLTLLEHVLGSDYLRLQYHVFYTFSREAINFLAIVNSSINFVIYLIFGKDFRKELIVIYGCCDITVRLPDHDKFTIWRQIARRRWLSKKTRRGTIENEVRHLSINDFAAAFVHSISDDSLQSYLQTRLTELDREQKNNNNYLGVPMVGMKQNGYSNGHVNGFLNYPNSKIQPNGGCNSVDLIVDKPLDEYSDSEIIFV